MPTTHVMILEDEMIIARDLERILKNQGINSIDIANSSREALTLARQINPRILISDINLEEQGVDGIEVATTIRSLTGCQIIYVTAHANQSIRDRAIDSQPTNYILKPFSEVQIQVALELALNDVDTQEAQKGNRDFLALFTPTEKQIIIMIAKQMTTKEIATQLYVSPKTVENHRRNIIEKLDLPRENNSLLKWVLSKQHLF